jgi:hypothetical protein
MLNDTRRYRLRPRLERRTPVALNTVAAALALVSVYCKQDPQQQVPSAPRATATAEWVHNTAMLSGAYAGSVTVTLHDTEVIATAAALPKDAMLLLGDQTARTTSGAARLSADESSFLAAVSTDATLRADYKYTVHSKIALNFADGGPVLQLSPPPMAFGLAPLLASVESKALRFAGENAETPTGARGTVLLAAAENVNLGATLVTDIAYVAIERPKLDASTNKGNLCINAGILGNTGTRAFSAITVFERRTAKIVYRVDVEGEKFCPPSSQRTPRPATLADIRGAVQAALLKGFAAPVQNLTPRR